MDRATSDNAFVYGGGHADCCVLFINQKINKYINIK